MTESFTVSNPHIHTDRPRPGLTEVCLMIESDNDIAACESVRVLTPDGRYTPVDFDADGLRRLACQIIATLDKAGVTAVIEALAVQKGLRKGPHD